MNLTQSQIDSTITIL